MPFSKEGFAPLPPHSFTHWRVWEIPSSQAVKKNGNAQRARIAELLAEGKSNAEIAREIGCTRENVRKHIRKIQGV